jgi:hypothetical protein
MAGANQSDISGTDLTVTLRGQTYKVSPLRLGDIGEFESYIRSRKLKELLDAAGSLESGQRAELMKELLSTDVTADELDAESRKVSGVRFLAFLALRRANPEITKLEQMDDIIGLDNFREVGTILDIMGGTRGRPPQQPDEPAASQ